MINEMQGGRFRKLECLLTKSEPFKSRDHFILGEGVILLKKASVIRLDPPN